MSRIFTLDNHPDWGVREARETLKHMEILADPRGVGLAYLSLGFCLRKQGNQWKFGGSSQKESEASFVESGQMFKRAAKIFKKEFNEPNRLWEANNELGSLYCDWGWMVRKVEDDKVLALSHYAEAIKYQEQARHLAEKYGLKSQILDSLDDLAQVYGDRSTLHIEMDNHVESDEDRKQAEAYLNEVDSLIDDKFKLIEGQGFAQEADEREGETQWVALGKMHLWRGLWHFRDIDYKQISGSERESSLAKAMENLFISSIYFRRYWPTSFDYDRAVSYLTDYLPRSGEGLEWAKKQVSKVERKYHVELTELHELVNRTVLF